MEKYSRKNLKNIQAIVQNKTGVVISANRKLTKYKIRRMALLAGCLLCFVTLSAFGYVKFSSLNGDEVGFALAYQGGGRFEIAVMNFSDRELKLQDNLKIMQWSTSEEVEGNNEKIKIAGLTIAPHSQGMVSIDISEGYDVEAMEENLQDGDWYYFVLTNNNFAFGQDWMCSFDFEIEQTEDVVNRLTEISEQIINGKSAAEEQYSTGNLIYSNWIWPTVSQRVSVLYGEQKNGTDSDHIILPGQLGMKYMQLQKG